MATNPVEAPPTSILGATKRVAEMILQAHADELTRFSSVRFGNVLGSRGSLLSVIAEQIENGEAVTVTHPDVTRFFMTIEEAVGLVIEAASMADGGTVFALDMGEPVRIIDLVRKYAAQMHLDSEDLRIRHTGLRRGEKLDETLFGREEERVATPHARIWAARSPPISRGFFARLEELRAAAAANNVEDIRRCLADLLPEYRPPTERDTPGAAAPYPDWF